MHLHEDTYNDEIHQTGPRHRSASSPAVFQISMLALDNFTVRVLQRAGVAKGIDVEGGARNVQRRLRYGKALTLLDVLALYFERRIAPITSFASTTTTPPRQQL